MTTPALLVFGYVAGGSASSLRSLFLRFAEALSRRIKIEVSLFDAATYAELTTAVTTGYVDIAWLPPLPFVRLYKLGAITPLAHIQRGGLIRFQSAIIVHEKSPYRSVGDLVGKRAAWVDRYSASGFVVPRVELERQGLDPRRAFSEQRMFHSHEAVVRAIALERADFGATYVGVASSGEISRAPWMNRKSLHPMRALSVVGDIPGDVISARSGLSASLRKLLVSATLRISRDLAKDAFNADKFRRFVARGYTEFACLVDDALARGLLDHTDVSDRRS